MDARINKMYHHFKGYLGLSNMRMVDVEHQVLALQSTPKPQAQEEDFDARQILGFSALLTVQMEIQKLGREIADMRKVKACQPAAKTQNAPMDALFPVKMQKS
jgi:hypothetical protein